MRHEQWLRKKATRVSEITASKVIDLQDKCDSLKTDLKSERAKTKAEALKEHADEVRNLQSKSRDIKESNDQWAAKSVPSTHTPACMFIYMYIMYTHRHPLTPLLAGVRKPRCHARNSKRTR